MVSNPESTLAVKLKENSLKKLESSKKVRGFEFESNVAANNEMYLENNHAVLLDCRVRTLIEIFGKGGDHSMQKLNHHQRRR